MIYEFEEFEGAGAAVCEKVAELMRKVGIDANAGAQNVYGTWDGVDFNITVNYYVVRTILIFVCNDEGNKILSLYANDNNGVFGGISEEGQFITTTFGRGNITTRTVFTQKRNINITKIINSANVDIAGLNIYIADAIVAPNVLYKDKAGKKFVGINSYMLVEYTD